MFLLFFSTESRIGRQPNAVKHATFIQVNRMKLEKGLPLEEELYDSFDAVATQDSESSQHVISTLSHAASVASYRDSNEGSNAIDAKPQSRTKRTYRRRRSELQCNNVPFTENTDTYLGVTIKQENVSPPAVDENSFAFHVVDSVPSRNLADVGNSIGCGSHSDDSYMCSPSWQSQTSRLDDTSRDTNLSLVPHTTVRANTGGDNFVESAVEPRYRRKPRGDEEVAPGDSSSTDLSDSNDNGSLPDLESVIQSMKQAYEELVTMFSRVSLLVIFLIFTVFQLYHVLAHYFLLNSNIHS